MKIATKISISFLITGVILSTAGSTVFYMIARSALHKEIVQHLDTTSQSRKDHIETYLQMIEISVSQLSKSVVLEDFLKTAKDDPRIKEAFETATKRLKRTKDVNPAIYEFMLLDKNGMVVASSSASSIGQDMSADAYFTGGQKGVYIKDAYHSEIKNRPLIGVSTPVVDSQTGELLGVLAARVELDDLNRITMDRTGLGKTGKIYLVNKHGYMITPSRFLPDTFLEKKVNTQNYRACASELDEGKEHPPEVIGTDYRGRMTLGTHACIHMMEWSLLTEMDLDEAYAPLRTMLAVALVIILLIPLAAWLAGVIVSGAITAPIHWLHRGTEIIGEGNLDYKVGTDSKDEIGQLSRSFDQMTHDLKSKIITVDRLNEEIAQRKSLEHVLREKEARFRAIFNSTFQFTGLMTLDGTLIEANQSAVDFTGLKLEDVINRPFWETHWWRGNKERVQKLKESIRLAASGKFIRYETELQGAGDTTAIFDFSIKPAFGPDGKVAMLVPEGRDITERKLADERIRKISELQATLLEPGTPENKFKTITDNVVAIFGADFCRIWLIASGDRCAAGCPHAAAIEGPHVCRHRDRCLHLVASSGRYTHTDGGAHARVPFGCYKIGTIASGETKSFLTNDVVNDPRVHNHAWAKELGLVSFAGFRLSLADKEPIGVLALFSRRAISTEEYAFIEVITNIVVKVVQTAVQEKALAESENKFKTLFESSKDAIMMLTPERGFFDANAATIELFGCKDKAQFVTMGPAHLSPEFQPDGKRSSEKAQEMMAIAMEKGSNFFEWTHKRVDGREFFATVLLTRVELKGEAVLQATVRDITERRKAEKIIANAAKEWSSTFDSMSEGVSIHSVDSDILNVNAALCEMLGKKRDELIGKKCYRVFHGKNAPIPGCPMEGSKETGKKVRVEVFEPAVNLWLNVSVSPVHDEKGEVVKLIHVISDITDRKKAEAKVAEAMDVKSKFLSMVSHELRTPMTAIKEGIGIVLDGSAGAVNDEQKDFLDTAKRNVDRLSRLINDVLDYQRLEAGRTAFVMTRGSIAALIDDAVKVMLPVAKAKNLTLKTRVAPGLPEMIFDADKLTQVLINFVNNAIKFTDAGGVTIAASIKDGSVVVSIEDTGVGIKKEDIPKLFQDFSQLDEGRARKGGSTGLGLAISKKMVEAHGGEVWVESDPGKGSQFKFRVPIRTKFRVLVVDDDSQILDVCRRTLEKEGYEVACAETGLKGVEMVQKNRPDILLLDMRLGDINGYEIIGRLRSSRETATIPILAMSGYIEELAKLEDKREDSALSSIAKPFKFEDMVAMVRGMLRQGA